MPPKVAARTSSQKSTALTQTLSACRWKKRLPLWPNLEFSQNRPNDQVSDEARSRSLPRMARFSSLCQEIYEAACLPASQGTLQADLEANTAARRSPNLRATIRQPRKR